MKNKIVSIVVPTYNQRKYLKDCVMSILNQDYDNYEILICDDGSTDQTPKLIKHLQKRFPSKIKYFKLKHTGSPAIPRNVGMKNAKGYYIAFLDSDDIMNKLRIGKQVKLLEANHKIDIICSNALMFNDDSKETKPYFNDLKEGFISLKQLFDRNLVIQSTVLMKKEVMDIVGYYYERKKFYHEDYEYLLRALYLNQKIYYLAEPLTKYRINPLGISCTLSPIRDIKKSIKTFNILRKNVNLDKETKKMINNKIKVYKKKMYEIRLKKYKPIYLLLKRLKAK